MSGGSYPAARDAVNRGRLPPPAPPRDRADDWQCSADM